MVGGEYEESGQRCSVYLCTHDFVVGDEANIGFHRRRSAQPGRYGDHVDFIIAGEYAEPGQCCS